MFTLQTEQSAHKSSVSTFASWPLHLDVHTIGNQKDAVLIRTRSHEPFIRFYGNKWLLVDKNVALNALSHDLDTMW